MCEVRPSGYDKLASEYYDFEHKTSRNFDITTTAALSKAPPKIPDEGFVLEVGCGKGRGKEYLSLSSNRIIQLDSSRNMLALNDRESCCLQLHADATSIPLFDGQINAVVGFLIDPFAGLNFFREAYRVLVPGGRFFATTPTAQWGLPLREQIEVEASFTRFVTRDRKIVEVPSTLIPQDELMQMLEYSGFEGVEVTSHTLPQDTDTISEDILRVADEKEIDVYSLPIVHFVSASKPHSLSSGGN